MEIGIGLPATIPGVNGERILEWARRADAGPFSSLGIIDRLVYPNFEPMITLAAAAGATRRIGLMTTILLAPLRNTGVLAKEAASLDALSGGRLTLGLAVGGREDDYRAAPSSFRDRGRRFEEQLATMKRIWSGEALGDGVGRVGPPPARAGGPPILIGAYSPQAIRRVGRWAEGFIAAGAGDLSMTRQAYAIAEEAWRDAGRPGRPRFVGGMYFALGPDAANKAAAYIKDYYAFLGAMAEGFARSIPSSVQTMKGAIQGFADIGMDELICWPCIPELDQVERLAQLVG
jgi:alkanesulfonate monooxygenase SsuD/methylene tetrahydromethanopterin reductase-like flavin-dependent oxidoreductase (luciferase family)